MSMRRRRFRLLSLGLAFALLAAQWALAGYACPKEQRAAAMAAASSSLSVTPYAQQDDACGQG